MSFYNDLNAYVVTLGAGAPGWNDCGLSSAQVNDLVTNAGPNGEALIKRWYAELKAEGGNPYTAITASHEGVLALQPQILAWAKGQEYDPKAAQIKNLKAQLAGTEADIAAGVKPEDTNYARIVAQLKALGVDVDAPPELSTSPAPVTLPALNDRVTQLENLARTMFGRLASVETHLKGIHSAGG
jgi:hypothetical protein